MDKAKWRPKYSDFSFDALVGDFELKTEKKVLLCDYCSKLTFGKGCSIFVVKSSVSFESLKIVLNSSRISPCMKTFPDFEELTL